MSELGLRSNVSMWIKREDYERLVTQAAQCEPLKDSLAVALERARSAEDILAVERNAKDHLITQLTSRFLTKQGSYGLDHEPQPKPEPHPKGYTHEPSEYDLAKLEFYKQCARNAGKDEDDAVMRWEAEMRGESLPIESETEQ